MNPLASPTEQLLLACFLYQLPALVEADRKCPFPSCRPGRQSSSVSQEEPFCVQLVAFAGEPPRPSCRRPQPATGLRPEAERRAREASRCHPVWLIFGPSGSQGYYLMVVLGKEWGHLKAWQQAKASQGKGASNGFLAFEKC